MRNYGTGNIVDTFIHSAIWSAGRRFIYSIPLPIILIFGAVCVFLFITKKIRSSRPAKTAKANTTVVKRDGEGNVVSTTTTTRK